jgi:hypothetical protein
MVKKTRRAKAAKLGKQDRWPSDYCAMPSATDRRAKGLLRSSPGGPAEKGPGRKGRSSGGGDSAGESRASAGPDRKDKR